MTAKYEYMNKDRSDHRRAENAMAIFIQEFDGKGLTLQQGIMQRPPYCSRQEIELRKKIDSIIEGYLRPSEKEALVRLLKGLGYWTDARALVYALNPRDYSEEEDMAVTYINLRPALSKIRKAIQGAGYIIEVQRRSKDNTRLNTHYRLVYHGHSANSL
jgi:hypothetical protein